MIGLTSSLFRSINSMVRTPSTMVRPEQGHDQGERAGIESIDEISTRPLLFASRASTPARRGAGHRGARSADAVGRDPGGLRRLESSCMEEHPIPRHEGAGPARRIVDSGGAGPAPARAAEGRSTARPCNPAYATFTVPGRPSRSSMHCGQHE